MNDDRRSAPRIPAVVAIEVTDTITGDRIGRVGNLSRNGVMLICRRALRDDALYQLRLAVPGRAEALEIGVHTMWTQAAATGDHQWSGHRIISIDAAGANLLERWIQRDAA